MHPEEYIAAYCDYAALVPALKDGNYSAAKQRVEEALSAIRADFSAGEVDSEERALLVNCLLVVMQYHVMFALYSILGCEPGDTYAARQAMRSDYLAWKEKRELSAEPWLFDENGKPAGGKREKLRIFKAIDALLLSIEDFDEIAPVSQPKWQKKQYGDFEMVTIADAEIIDDGGFFGAADPLDKDFVLRDADGAVYHLHSVRRSHIPGGLSTDGAKHYAADGYIEGYTSDSPREIEFEAADGQFVFTYSTDGTAEADAAAETLWSAYEAWANARIAARRARQQALY